MYIYIYHISFCSKSHQISALSQFLNNEKPDLVAHESSTFYRIKLKPQSISGAARKWQILPLKPKISGTER
jgi:hypothetical protein